MENANETIITCVQIESKQAVNNIHAICAVQGIGKYYHLLPSTSLSLIMDMVFIGPNNLALSLLTYVPANDAEPGSVKAIDVIFAAARNHGKLLGRISNIGVLCKSTSRIRYHGAEF